MKTWILAMAMMAGVTMSAQADKNLKLDNKRPGKEHHEPFTPEQRAELKVKQLTLALDLSNKQQKEMQKLLLDQNKDREQFIKSHKANVASGKKPSADERFAMQTKRIDAQIAMQREVRKVLTEEQFSKYEEMKTARHERFKDGSKNFKRSHERNSRR
jgi:protein CpxP